MTASAALRRVRRRRAGSSSTPAGARPTRGSARRSSRSSPSTLGYDHLWVYDHVETVPRREPTHVFEAFTTLAALAQHTSTIKLGQLVTCAAYRNAGLLAKEAACVDVFSGGRLILGLGAGWYEREYQAYGYAVPERGRAAADPRRDARGHQAALDRGDRHLRRASTSRSTARTATRSRSSSCPPIWVGGGGEKVTLRIAARHADATNWQVGLDGFVHKSEVLRGALRRDRPRLRLDRAHARSRLPALRHRRRPAARGSTRPGGGSLWGRGDPRRVRARQPRRHRRAGRREGAGVRRRRLPRVRALVPRLPVDREPRSGSPPRSCRSVSG